jgi:predicted extracellular nuclease
MKCMNISRIVLITVSVFMLSCSYHTETANKSNKTGSAFCRIAFYNVENLFDTEDDPHTNDNDFLPSGKLKWNNERYQQKLEHIKEVFDGLNKEHTLALLGMAEVENKVVLEELLKNDSTYQIIHYNSSDKRGIDVCVLYNTNYFTPLASYLSYGAKEEKDNVFFREVLVVKGILWNDTVHVLVNHWPSRREGKEESEHKRIAASKLTFRLIDSISKNTSSNIIIMGDFNDQPNDKSVSDLSLMFKLRSTPQHNDASDIINPFAVKQNAGEGTCKFKRDWFLFDQILVNNSLMNKKGCQFVAAEIYDPEWLYYKEDINSGPYRTYLGNKYYGGYSDHFPVYIELKK